MDYEAFNYIEPSFFGLPTFAIAIALVIALGLIGAFVSWKTLYRGERSILAVSCGVLLSFLLVATLGAHLSYPSKATQENRWNNELTEQFNDYYDLELSPEQFDYLSSFQEFPNDETVYGPTLKLQTGVEPQDFTSLVLSRSKGKLELLQLVGADYAPVSTAKA